MKFNIGDKVLVTNQGNQYSTYNTYYDRYNKDDSLPPFKNGAKLMEGDLYTVMSLGNGEIILITDYIYTYLIGVEGIFKPTKNIIIEPTSTESASLVPRKTWVQTRLVTVASFIQKELKSYKELNLDLVNEYNDLLEEIKTWI